MKPDDILTFELRPGPDGWEQRPVTRAEFDVLWARATAPTSDPPTTRDLAVQGELIGTAEDVLLVAAFLRCRHSRAPLGAVLHLDGPGRTPMMLAELRQAEAGRILSRETVRGVMSTGARLAELDAVPLDDALLDGRYRVDVDCPADTGVVHRLSVRSLFDAGREGYDKNRRAYRESRRPTPISVDLDDVEKAYSSCTIAAMRDDPYGTGNTRPSVVLRQGEHR